MKMDFTIEIDDDEVCTISVDEEPKKKLRIQVEKTRFEVDSKAGVTTVHDVLLSSMNQDDNIAAMKAIGEKVAKEVYESYRKKSDPDPEWLKNDFCAVILAHMRDKPLHNVSRDAAARLEASDFPANRYALMFRALRSLMVKREKVTPVSVSEEARSIDPELALPAWFVDAVGGDNDDVDAASSLEWILSRRIIAGR